MCRNFIGSRKIVWFRAGGMASSLVRCKINAEIVVKMSKSTMGLFVDGLGVVRMACSFIKWNIKGIIPMSKLIMWHLTLNIS